jgi:hypothetical protein
MPHDGVARPRTFSANLTLSAHSTSPFTNGAYYTVAPAQHKDKMFRGTKSSASTLLLGLGEDSSEVSLHLLDGGCGLTKNPGRFTKIQEGNIKKLRMDE